MHACTITNLSLSLSFSLSLFLSSILTTGSRLCVFMLGIKVECMRTFQLNIQSHHYGMELAHLTASKWSTCICIFICNHLSINHPWCKQHTFQNSATWSPIALQAVGRCISSGVKLPINHTEIINDIAEHANIVHFLKSAFWVTLGIVQLKNDKSKMKTLSPSAQIGTNRIQ